MEPEGSLHVTRPHHTSLSSARWIQSTDLPNYISLKSTSILDFHSCLSSPIVSSPQVPHQNSVSTSLTPTHATCRTHLTSLDLLTIIIFYEDWKQWCSSLHSFLQSPVTSSLTDPNILLSTPFSNTLSLFYHRPSFAPTQNRHNFSQNWQTTNKSFTTLQKLSKR